jgi:hypothetical protein
VDLLVYRRWSAVSCFLFPLEKADRTSVICIQGVSFCFKDVTKRTIE